MMIEVLNRSKKGRKKQPKRRKVESTNIIGLPKIEVPGTAKKRRRRNSNSFRVPTTTIKKVATSSRWFSLVLLVLCTFSLLMIGTDQSFYFSAISVEGNSAIPDSEIIDASDLAGKHVFAANPTSVAGQVGEVAGVISATVTIGWPNRAIIEIAEETPIAIWEQGGKSYWITIDNRVVPARSNSGGLLRIESEQFGANTGQIFIPDDLVRGALHLKTLRPNIDHLFFRPGNGLSYQDGRGWRAFFGTGSAMDQKLVVYETLVEDLVSRGITPTYVSVSNQDKPYYLSKTNE
jgi:hypothetical protein